MPLTNPLISVCVPMYNKAAHAERCLRTVLDAAPEGLEIVIFDNGSTDGSSDIASRMAAADERIRYIRLEHTICAQESWRMAMMHGRGEFLKLHSADDEFEPEFFTHMLPPLQASPELDYTLCADFVEARGVEFNMQLPKTWNESCQHIIGIADLATRARQIVISGAVHNNFGTIYKVLFRRRCLPLARWRTLTVSFPMYQSYGDWDLLIRLLLNHRGLFVDKPLSRFVVMANSPLFRQRTNPWLRVADRQILMMQVLTILTDPTLCDLRAAIRPEEIQQILNVAQKHMLDSVQLALSLPKPEECTSAL